MSAGRCVGCGYIDSSRKVEIHIVDCGAYLVIFRSDPDRCLDPVDAYQHYRDTELSFEARAGRKEIRLGAQLARLDQAQAAQTHRWQRPKDVLDD